MKIIYNRVIPFPDFAAMNLFGVVFARWKCRPLSATTLNREAIISLQYMQAVNRLHFLWN